MNVLVTGARGFVGLNVARHLASGGHRVIAADLSPVDEWVKSFLAGVEEPVEHVVANISAPGDLERAVGSGRVDAVIHAAVITATTLDVEIGSARRIVDTNVAGTVEALEFAVSRGARRFVYVSSPAAIGEVPGDRSIDESIVPVPTSLYGITKLASEQIVRRWGVLHPIECVSVRIAQPYGPGERATASRLRTSPIQEWLVGAVTGERLVTGSLERARDWTYVVDTARGIAELATRDALSHDLYHLGTGEQSLAGDVIKLLEAHFGPLDIDPSPNVDALNPNIAGPGRAPLDPRRFERDFGWKPEISLDEGIDRYIRWWNEFRGLLVDGSAGAGWMIGTGNVPD